MVYLKISFLRWWLSIIQLLEEKILLPLLSLFHNECLHFYFLCRKSKKIEPTGTTKIKALPTLKEKENRIPCPYGVTIIQHALRYYVVGYIISVNETKYRQPTLRTRNNLVAFYLSQNKLCVSCMYRFQWVWQCVK